MKKTICLFASIFYAGCIFLVPAMFFMFTDATAFNLSFASILSAMSGLASYSYFLNYKNK